jgi:hypothetical protein
VGRPRAAWAQGAREQGGGHRVPGAHGQGRREGQQHHRCWGRRAGYP